MRSLHTNLISKRNLVAALTAATLAVPAAAIAQPGHGNGHTDAPKVHGKPKKAKKVTFVFRGTFAAPGTIQVLAGNSHVRKGGFVGQAVTFDFTSAKIVVADTNADQTLDVTDVKDGDLVLVQARVAKGTEFAAPAEGEVAEAVVARKLVDKTNPPADEVEAEG
jgi:hypothetical protein